MVPATTAGGGDMVDASSTSYSSLTSRIKLINDPNIAFIDSAAIKHLLREMKRSLKLKGLVQRKL